MNSIRFIVLFLCCLGCSTPDLILKKSKKLRSKKVSFGPTHPKESLFTAAASKFGLKHAKATNLYAVDFNSDGKTDLVVLPDHFSVPIFYQSRGKKFEKLQYDPFIEKNKASFLAFVDLNKDGVLDLFLGTLNQKTELTKYPLRLFKGELRGGKIFYKEIMNALPATIYPNSSLTLLDFNLDGEIDLFLGNWYNFLGRTRKMSADRLLRGKGFQFKDITGHLKGEGRFIRASKTYPNALPTRGSSSCDINQDGYPDLLTAVSSGYPNKLWLNLPDKTYGRIFRNIADKSSFAHDYEGILDPKGGGNTYFAICADYNNDGIMDVAMGELTHSYESEMRDRSSILTGDVSQGAPKFIRSEYYADDGSTKWTQADRRAGWFDYNNDGLLDLFVVNSGYPPKTRLILFEQEDNHAFDDIAKRAGVDIVNPSGTIYMDIDRDGRLDIITGQTRIRNASIKDQVYVFNNQSESVRSLRIYPYGVKSNRAALGAMLILKSKTRTQRQWVEYLSGSLPSQNEEGVHFGLPRGDDPLMLTVKWPILRKGKPLVVSYRLKGMDLDSPVKITVCENGKFFLGRKRCR